MSKIKLYVYDNTGYQCNNLLGFVKYNEVTKEYIVTDHRDYLKGRVFAKVDNISKNKDDRDELISELKLMFKFTRLFIETKRIKQGDQNG
jgi:hypothetical protein